WGELVASYLRAVRSELVRFGGEELESSDERFVGAFDGADRAIRCALAVIARSAGLGLSAHAGAHTGEVENVEGRTSGITRHVSSRIAEFAASTELLISTTTRELAAGSGLVFLDRGEHALRGVQQQRRLYAVVEAPGTATAARAIGPAAPEGITYP